MFADLESSLSDALRLLEIYNARARSMIASVSTRWARDCIHEWSSCLTAPIISGDAHGDDGNRTCRSVAPSETSAVSICCCIIVERSWDMDSKLVTAIAEIEQLADKLTQTKERVRSFRLLARAGRRCCAYVAWGHPWVPNTSVLHCVSHGCMRVTAETRHGCTCVPEMCDQCLRASIRVCLEVCFELLSLPFLELCLHM